MSPTFELAIETDEVTKEKLFYPKYSLVSTFQDHLKVAIFNKVIIIHSFFFKHFLESERSSIKKRKCTDKNLVESILKLCFCWLIPRLCFDILGIIGIRLG